MSARAVAFRCNAGVQTGFGHLMRCRELARLLAERGVASVMYGPEARQRAEADRSLFAAWRPAPFPDPDEDEQGDFLAFCRSAGARHAILDDYRIDPSYQRRLHEAGLRFLHQFDASAPPERFWADFAVNANLHETEETHARRIANPHGRLLLGPAYAVLRPEFRAVEKRPPAKRASTVLLTFGGGDDRGMILRTLTALEPHISSGLKVEIISGALNPRNDGIRAALENRRDGRVTLHVNPPDVARIMARADIAVMAGGTSTYEAAHCGAPMVLVALTPNQVNPGRGWAEHTGSVFLGTMAELTDEGLRAGVSTMIDDDARRIETALRCRRKVQGDGGERLLDALLGEINA